MRTEILRFPLGDTDDAVRKRSRSRGMPAGSEPEGTEDFIKPTFGGSEGSIRLRLSGFLRVDLVATDDFQEPAALAEDASARSIRPHADPLQSPGKRGCGSHPPPAE